MPSPVTSSDICATVPGSTLSNLCTKVQLVFLRLPQLLCNFFTWMLNTDGTLSAAFLSDVALTVLPPGTIIPYAGGSVPSGYLSCEGQELTITDYPNLYANIGTTWGIPSGATKFKLPDLRGKFLLGKSATHSLASTGGEETHTLVEAELPAHSHSGLYCKNVAHGSGSLEHSGNVYALVSNDGALPQQTGTFVGSGTADTGSGTAHNTLPPYSTILWLIKT